MEDIKKQTNLKMEKCPECGQEITGHTEPQVMSRMRMHMITHQTKGEPTSVKNPSEASNSKVRGKKQ